MDEYYMSSQCMTSERLRLETVTVYSANGVFALSFSVSVKGTHHFFFFNSIWKPLQRYHLRGNKRHLLSYRLLSGTTKDLKKTI